MLGSVLACRFARIATLLALCVLTACVTPTAPGDRRSVPSTPATLNYRGGDDIVLNRLLHGKPVYNYAPSVMVDGVYRMWWCGGIAGDYILYAEAPSPDGPWHSSTSDEQNSFDIAFQPTGVDGDFDGLHTCDPSVIRVGGLYYLYYGGGRKDDFTRIGIARSDDGIRWTRMNDGRPIVIPRAEIEGRHYNGEYGAGQPSITYVDGYFYLIYTDTTGLGPSGVYVKRARYPDFSDAEDMIRDKAGHVSFVTSSGDTYGVCRLYHGVNVDWQYSDMYQAFLVVGHFTPGEINMTLFDHSLSYQVGEAIVRGRWNEGPGVISRPDRHSIVSAIPGRVPVDVLRAVDTRPEPHDDNPFYWQMSHLGVDLQIPMNASEVNRGLGPREKSLVGELRCGQPRRPMVGIGKSATGAGPAGPAAR